MDSGRTMMVVLFLVVPVMAAITGVYISRRRLKMAGLRFHYSLLDCLAAMVISIPTSALLALFSMVEGSGRGALELAAMLTTLVCAQALGLVSGRTKALLQGDEGLRSFAWVLLLGMLGIIGAILYTTVCILAFFAGSK